MSTTTHIGNSGFIPFAPPAPRQVDTTESARPFLPADKRPTPPHQLSGENGKKPHSPLLNGNNMLAAQESKTPDNPGGLNEAETEQVAKLKKQDTEVRAHEQAHAAAGGQFAGAPQYQYETGPDGGQYAVSGHVSIDVSPVQGDPAATIQKMQVVKQAASAPSDPSAQDRSVAAKAEQEIRKAREEQSKQSTENSQNGDGPDTDKTGNEQTPGAERPAATANIGGIQQALPPILSIIV